MQAFIYKFLYTVSSQNYTIKASATAAPPRINPLFPVTAGRPPVLVELDPEPEPEAEAEVEVEDAVEPEPEGVVVAGVIKVVTPPVAPVTCEVVVVTSVLGDGVRITVWCRFRELMVVTVGLGKLELPVMESEHTAPVVPWREARVQWMKWVLHQRRWEIS